MAKVKTEKAPLPWVVLEGDCAEVMKGLREASVDAVVCDPPYGLGFMGKEFDTFDRDFDVPADLGMWLAGLTDGEGNFDIHRQRRESGDYFYCRFEISLRADDGAILHMLAARLGGKVYRGDSGNGNEKMRWEMVARAECSRLATIFDRYPLQSKKARDYAIWREALVESLKTPGVNRPEAMQPFWERLRAGRAYAGPVTDTAVFKHAARRDGYEEFAYRWALEAYRVLKPGGYLVAFGGTRTYHRLACAVEDTGFEIRDSLHWMYGSGFSKSLRVNADSRFCQCAFDGASARSAVGTIRERDEDAHTNTEALSASPHADAPSPSAPRASHTKQGSRGDCLPGRGSGDEQLHADADAARASLPSRADAPRRTRSRAPDDAPPELGHGCTPRVQRSDHPSTPDSSHPSVPLATASGISESIPSSALSDSAGAQSTFHTASISPSPRNNVRIGFATCQVCGKPIADGFGTALKPAHEPIVLARKPLAGTVAQNVQKYGTGGLNIDGCRVKGEARKPGNTKPTVKFTGIWNNGMVSPPDDGAMNYEPHVAGRWPPNVLLNHVPPGENGDGGCRQIGTKKVKGAGSHNRHAIPRPASVAKGADDAFISAGYGDGNQEVTEAWACAEGCPVAALDSHSGPRGAAAPVHGNEPSDPVEEDAILNPRKRVKGVFHADSGGASRFFPVLNFDPQYDAPFLYQAKASRSEREAGLEEAGIEPRTGAEAVDREEDTAGLKSPRAGAGRTTAKVRNNHPTVKPIALMRWLVRLVAPPGGLVLDPFVGSGTTGIAAVLEGFRFLGIEREADYVRIARARIEHHAGTKDAMLTATENAHA